jgi:hypothetical protein
MAQFFLEAFQWQGVKRGDAFGFYAGDSRVEGPHPLCSSGGILGNGRTRTAMYTDSIEQLRGSAGARQVRVRAETALGGIHHAKQWRLDHVRQIPELTYPSVTRATEPRYKRPGMFAVSKNTATITEAGPVR